MTLGRFSILLSALMTVVPVATVLATGQPALTMWILLAPVPSMIVYGFLRDYEDWTLGDALDRIQGESPIAADLDAALRPPPPIARLDDDAFFVPGVPMPDGDAETLSFGPPAQSQPVGPPRSTPA